MLGLGGGSEIDSWRRELVKEALLDVSNNSLVVGIGRATVPPFVPLMASLHKTQRKGTPFVSYYYRDFALVSYRDFLLGLQVLTKVLKVFKSTFSQ